MDKWSKEKPLMDTWGKEGTLNPSYVQLPNFNTHVCSSNGKNSTSISHDDLNMAGGFHSTRPTWYMVALVASVTSKFPSALRITHKQKKIATKNKIKKCLVVSINIWYPIHVKTVYSNLKTIHNNNSVVVCIVILCFIPLYTTSRHRRLQNVIYDSARILWQNDHDVVYLLLYASSQLLWSLWKP